VPDWSAAQYLKFADQRTRPAADLLARIALAAPARVVDLGCGPGNSTSLLAARWPGARLSGLDNAPDMLATARRAHPTIDWIETDLSTWQPPERYDVVFSNAALQWVPDHARLFPRLLTTVAPGGVLAVQMPRAAGKAQSVMREIAAGGPWAGKLAGQGRAQVHAPSVYYELLARVARRIDLWETEYHQVMADTAAIAEWLKGSGLRSFLPRLSDDERAQFLARYQAALDAAYPRQSDGRVIFPFRRLFMICEN
jgi:trans-aconitate 2-methyltransferase